MITLTGDITALAVTAGITLTPGQEKLLAAGMRKNGDGRWAQFQVTVPADQDEVILVRELAGMFLLGERVLRVSAGHAQSAAQARKTAQLVLGRPDLARRVTDVSRAHGGELIGTWDASIRFMAQPGKQGYAADLIVLGPGTDRGSRLYTALVPWHDDPAGPADMESRRVSPDAAR
jgi:hypothetical protein